MCKLCSAFRRDQRLLRQRMAQVEERAAEDAAAANVRLAPEAKRRLQKQIDSRLS